MEARPANPRKIDLVVETTVDARPVLPVKRRPPLNGIGTRDENPTPLVHRGQSRTARRAHAVHCAEVVGHRYSTDGSVAPS